MENMARRIGLMAAVLGLVAGAASRARADILTYDFTGTVDRTGGTYDPYLGRSVIGTFTFDTGVPAYDTAPNQAKYHTGRIAFRIDGGPSFDTTTVNTSVQNDYDVGTSVFDGLSIAGTFSPGFIGGLGLSDSTHTAFDSMSLPAALHPSSFDTKGLGGYDSSLSGDYFNVTLDRVTLASSVASTPEPTTILPASIVSLMGLGCAWRRRGARLAA
jgi:hypothetical protein